MGLVMNVCDRVLVLDYGRRIAEGPPAQVQRAPKVIEALGKAAKEKSATEGKTFGDLIKDGTLKLTPEEK